jgi:MFS family permease
LLVASGQAAANLPIFFLAIPAGALADIVDRRWLLIVAQSWMLLVAGALAAMAFAGQVTPWVLLATKFMLGLGAAMKAPAWQAMTPELIRREQGPAAIASNGVSMNVARAVGPALGGLMVAASGPAASFAFCAFGA